MFALVLSIIMAELMIRWNNVSTGGEDWTYGQLVAVILLAGPLFTLQRVIRDELSPSNSKPLSRRPATTVIKLLNEVIWGKRKQNCHQELTKQGDQVRFPFFLFCFRVDF